MLFKFLEEIIIFNRDRNYIRKNNNIWYLYIKILGLFYLINKVNMFFKYKSIL